MGKKSETKTYDITKLGPRKFYELQQQNAAMQGTPNSNFTELTSDDGYEKMSHNATTHNPLQNMQRDVFSPLYGKGDYWGRSVHDEDIAIGDQFNHLANTRAENQWGIEQLLNGTIKMGTTAATTFLDSTVGTLWGLIQGTVNLFDDDPNSGFWQGMWDNDFNRTMSDVQDAMEKIVPNYYTEKELSNPWYKNVLSANFFGDKLFKNAGFTIGAVAAMTLPGVGVAGAGARAGIEGIGKVIQASKYIKNAETAAKVLRGSHKVGGITEKLINSFISANGEAMIESINAIKGNEESLTNNINQWAADAHRKAEQEYYTTGDREAYQKNIQEIAEAQEAALQEAADTATGIGNSIYFGNIGLLMLTNNLEFGKYIKGGWKPQKGMEAFDMMVSGEKAANMQAFGRALAEGTGALKVPEAIGKVSAGRVALGTGARFLEEGFEEGAQNIISDSGQMQQQALLNKWAKDKYTDSSLFAAEINPGVTDDLVDRMKAIGEAWHKNFGSGLSAPGWEEVFLGGLTGGLGTISVHTNPTTGKWNVWDGGFMEEIRRPQEELQQITKVVEAFNEHTQSKQFRDKARHAIAAATFADVMDSAVRENDIMAFKNAELMAIANDALYFRNHEGLPAYKAFYERMSELVTDEDIAAVKSQLRKLETGESWVDSKTPDELREILKDKAKSTLDKANSVLDLFDIHQQRYTDKLAKIDEEKNTNYLGAMLIDLTAKAALIEDLNRRKEELKKEQDSTSAIAKKASGDTYAKDIEQIDAKIQELTEQYNGWLNNLETLHEKIDERVKLAEKYRVGQNAQQAKERLKTVSTLQEVADFYFSTDPKFRQRVFDQATREAEGPVKDLLTSFRPFVATVNSLTNLISKRGKAYAQDLYDEWASYEEDVDEKTKSEILELAQDKEKEYEPVRREVERVVESFIEDPEAAYNKKTLEWALRERAVELLLDPELNATPTSRAKVSFIAGELNALSHAVKKLDDTYRETEEYQELKKEDDKKPENTEGSKNKPAAKPKEDERKATIFGPISTAKNPLTEDENAPEEHDTEAELPQAEEEPEEQEDENPQGEINPHFVAIPQSEVSPEAAEADLQEDIVNTDVGEELPENVSSDQPGFVESASDAGEGPTISLRGNAFHQYKTSDLVTGLNTKNSGTGAGSYYKLLEEKGIDVDFLQNNYLYQLRKLFPEERLPVEYMVMRGGNRGKTDGILENHVFLVTPYTDRVQEVIKRGDSKISGNIITSNGREYVVVGTLGYSGRQKDLADQYERVKKILFQEAISRTGEEFIVHDSSEDGLSNYIHGQSKGYVIRKDTKEAPETPVNMSLKTLLDTANPRGLKFGDLRWVILEGSSPEVKDPMNRKWINKKDGDNPHELPVQNLGKMYLYLQASDGTLIPQAVLPIRFKDMSESNGEVWTKAEKAIRNIAQAKTPEEREDAFGKLREQFVFKPKYREPGTNIFYDKATDTVTYSVGNLTQRDKEGVISFAENPSEEEVFDKLMNMMAEVNPLYRFRAKTLGADPGYYINNNMIQVNLRSLGTFDSRSYVYPLNADNTPAIDFKPTQRPSESPRPKPERIVYFQNEMYRITQDEDGTTHVSTKDRIPVTDDTLLKEMQDVMQIVTGQLPATKLTAVGKPEGKKFNYYISSLSEQDENTFVYVESHAGGYRRLTGTDLKIFRSRFNYAETERERGQAVTEALKSETPEEQGIIEDNLLFENPPFEADNAPQPAKKEEVPAVAAAKNPNFVKAVMKDFKDNMDSFLEVGKKNGLTWNLETSISDIEEVLRSGKYGEMYAKVHDADSLREYLDKIDECGI